MGQLVLLSVFSQSHEPLTSPERLRHEAKRHFSLDLTITRSQHDTWVLRREGSETDDAVIRQRVATPQDRELAAAAERRNDAAGMAALAERCPVVLELSTAGGVPEAVAYQLAACLAFVVLGPILPPDHRGLFGVRSAMAEAERLST